MNGVIIFIIIFYITITGYFLFKFFKNDFSLNETILSIKSDLKKILKCCINKKNIENKLSKRKSRRIRIRNE